jgi:hypothetical protein
MTQDYLISKENWDKILNELLGKYDVYAPVAGLKDNRQPFQRLEEKKQINTTAN